MILAAHLIDADQVKFSITDSPEEIRELSVALMQPAMVHRSTGTFREPELLVDLPTRLVSALHTAHASTPAPGQVVVLAVHAASRRAAAVGVFVDAAAASSWWFQPFNRLAQDRDVLFLTVAVGSAAG